MLRIRDMQKIFFKRTMLLTCAALLLLFKGVRAEDYTYIPDPIHIPDPIQPLCDALSSDESYKKDGGYRYITPGKDGWLFRSVTDFKMDFALKDNARMGMRRLYQALKERHIDLVIALQPTRGIMGRDFIDYSQIHAIGFDPQTAESDYKQLVSDLRTTGITVVDLSSAPRGNDFFYRTDIHWNEKGADYAAKAVADAVKALPSYGSLPKISYVTKVGETETTQGKIAEAAEEICGTSLPEEIYHERETAPEKEESAADALFSRFSYPKIVLLGTSNSKMHANFDGELKDYLDADLLNMAVGGGGIDTSLLDYLSSEEYKKTPPRVIVWEIPAYYDFNDQSLYAQAIPAIEGECSSKTALLEENLTLRKGQELFDKQFTAAGRKAYVYMRIPQKDIPGKLGLKIDYDGAPTESINLITSDRMQREDFFVEFDLQRGIPKIFVNTKKGERVPADLRVCEYAANSDKSMFGWIINQGRKKWEDYSNRLAFLQCDFCKSLATRISFTKTGG